jgi:hypothetical protein
VNIATLSLHGPIAPGGKRALSLPWTNWSQKGESKWYASMIALSLDQLVLVSWGVCCCAVD